MVGQAGSSRSVTLLGDGGAGPMGWEGSTRGSCDARGRLSHDRTRCKSEGMRNSCQMTEPSAEGVVVV